MLGLYRRFLADEDGANAIEYALIGTLIFVAVVGAVTTFATATSAMFTNISSHVK